MDLHLKYGQSSQILKLNDKINVEYINSKENDKEICERNIIKNALNNPIDSDNLKNIVRRDDEVCIIIPDITRLWQKPYIYLPYIVNELTAAGLKDSNIHFLCALGSHRKQTEEEHKKLLGEDLYSRFKVTDHDCRDENNLEYIGTTTFGTKVKINKLALSCNHIILTGGIVFHDMAGFGGGRKAILPGISGYETIMANHSLSLNPNGHGSNPMVKSAAVTNNPFNEDMMEAAEFVKPSFLFNVITNSKGEISDAVAGNYVTAHLKGCEMLKNIDGVQIQQKAELVIASCGGYPKDIDLYQASKTLTNAKEAVKVGGKIIILAECIEGLGHEEVEFIINNFKTNLERETELRENYTIAKYTGFLICEIAENFNVVFVTELNKNILKNCKVKIANTIGEAFSILNLDKSNLNSIYIMPNGGNTLPL